MLRVGLTGGIGSGKSAVSSALAARGAVVVDADVLARQVLAPGSDGLSEVVGTFGAGVLGTDGSLDRASLGRLVFGHEGSRRTLEALVHPRVRALARQREEAAAHDSVVVHDIPLLVETGQAKSFDVVVVVDVPPEVAVRRLVDQRGMSEDDARARMVAQADRDVRIAAADLVLDNTGTPDELDARVELLWQELLRRAATATD